MDLMSLWHSVQFLLVLASGRVGVLNFRNLLFALADLFFKFGLVAALSSFRSILSRLRFTIQPNAPIKNVSRTPISHHVPASIPCSVPLN